MVSFSHVLLPRTPSFPLLSFRLPPPLSVFHSSPMPARPELYRNSPHTYTSSQPTVQPPLQPSSWPHELSFWGLYSPTAHRLAFRCTQGASQLDALLGHAPRTEPSRLPEPGRPPSPAGSSLRTASPQPHVSGPDAYRAFTRSPLCYTAVIGAPAAAPSAPIAEQRRPVQPDWYPIPAHAPQPTICHGSILARLQQPSQRPAELRSITDQPSLVFLQRWPRTPVELDVGHLDARPDWPQPR